MFHKVAVKAFSAATILLSVGCTTAQNSIFRSFDLDSGRSVATDASQRIVINTKTHPSSRPGRVNPERIVCAEPSPDVASIVANTFGFGFNILGKGNAAVSGGQASALAQLAERTVTVQLLRDQMYRACEAYANGAISGTDYSLIMSRNNDAMVTLMLGESASRLVGRQLATLTATAGSEAEASMPGLLDAVDEMLEASEEESEAQEELAEAIAGEGAADAAVAATDEDDSEEAKDEAEEEAEEAEEEVAVAEEDAEEKSAAADAARAQVKNIVNATATPGGVIGGFPELNEHAVGVAKELAKMQEEYLDQGAEEHFLSACVVELGRTSKQYADFNQYDGYWGLDETGQDFVWKPFKYEPEKRIVFTRKEYSEIQYALMDSVDAKFNLNGDISNEYNLKNRRLTDFEIRALDYYYDNRNASPYKQFKLPKRKQVVISNSNGTSSTYFEVDLKDRHESTVQEIKTLFAQEITTSYEVIERLDDNLSVEVLGNALKKAFDQESDVWTGFFSNDRERTDRVMRATFAIEDRERASFLAKACLDHMRELLGREHEAHRLRDVLDFLERVEEVRAEAAKKPESKQDDKGKDKNKKSTTKKPDPKKPTSAEAVAEYVKCDLKKTEADKQICRIKALSGIIRTAAAPTLKGGGGKTPNIPPPPFSSGSAAYEVADREYAKYRDSVKKFEAVKLPALCANPKPGDKQRCQEIERLHDNKTALEQQRDAHTQSHNKEFSAATLATLKKQESDYKKTYSAWAKAKKGKKPALEKQMKALEGKLVPARSKFERLSSAFKNTAERMDNFVEDAAKLPKKKKP